MLEGGFRSIRSLAEGCGLAPATLAKRIQKEREFGSARIDGHTLQRIAGKTGFNAHWIMTGEGSPYLHDSHSDGAGPEQPVSVVQGALAKARSGVGRRDSVPLNARDPGADDGRRIAWGREVVAVLVDQGIAATRARHAVGALLLEADAHYSSVLELYQASLDRLGYTHTALTKEGASSANGRLRAASKGVNKLQGNTSQARNKQRRV